jgi:(2Fe-2S) ferredoxin
MMPWWVPHLLSLVAVALFGWRGSRIATERRAAIVLIVLTILLWGAVIALPALKPVGVGVELGVIFSYLWGWSEKAQTLVVLCGGIILGVAVYAGYVEVLLFSGVGAIIQLVVRNFWVRPPEFEPRAQGGRVRPYRYHAILCYGDACQLRGAGVLREAALALPQWKPDRGVRLTTSECLGYCRSGPVMWVEPEGQLFSFLRPKDLPTLLRQTESDNDD